MSGFIIIVVLVVLFSLVIRPVFLSLRDFKAKANFAYQMVSPEIKKLIDKEKVIELCDILVELELANNMEALDLILNACDSNGYSFMRRMDKVRNEMRIEAGLGKLKWVD